MLPAFEKRPTILLLAIITITCFVFPSHARAEDVLKIGGVGTALGSMQLLGAAFAKSHPGIKVVVLVGLGGSGGIKAVSKNAMDIGVTGRSLTDEERKLGLSYIEYAKTPFVFVTRNGAGKSSVTSGEIAGILRGDIQTWPSGERIRLVLHPANDSDTLIVKAISPEMSEAVEKALSREGMLMALSAQEAAEIVQRTPGGFGFSTLTQIISERLSLRILSYNGVAPSIRTLVDGSYPLFKRLSMVTRTESSDVVRQFVAFVHSREGRAILERSGNLVTGREPRKSP